MRRHVFRRSLVSSLACLLVTVSFRARAEPTPTETNSDPEHLFQAGVREMLAGHYSDACPMLQQSYERDPLPGVLFTLAECESGWKKLASALAHYQAFISTLLTLPAERRDRFEERRRVAEGQMAVLNITAPTLTVDLALATPATTVVSIDGVVAPEASYGVGRRMDPGSYYVSAELDGKRVWERTVVLRPSNHARLQVELAPAATQAESTEPNKPALRAAPDEDRGTFTPVSNPRTAAPRYDNWLYVAGGAGFVGLTTGFISGGLALGQKGNVDRHCPDLKCDPQGRAALDSARAQTTISNVAFSIGLVGASATALLLILAPRPSDPTRARAKSAKSTWTISSDGKTVAFAGRF